MSLMTGWKVMRLDAESGELVSGANQRLRLPCQVGTVISMPGQGVWVGLNAEYVQAHYRCHDQEVLLELEFDPQEIRAGNLTDREPEFAVPSARIISILHLEEE
jgi:hypothetical protein